MFGKTNFLQKINKNYKNETDFKLSNSRTAVAATIIFISLYQV